MKLAAILGLITFCGLAAGIALAQTSAAQSKSVPKASLKKSKSLPAESIDSSDIESSGFQSAQEVSPAISDDPVEPAEVDSREAIFKAQRDLQRARTQLLDEE